jgi:large subunit ribosomal protein L34
LTGKGIFALMRGFPKARQNVARRFAPARRLPTGQASQPRRPAFPRISMKRTYQASKVRRARTHGFLVRMKTRGGRAVINARRAKGRKRLAV